MMWRDTLIDAAAYGEWMMGIGGRSAYKNSIGIGWRTWGELQE
jgi:hypothetical protein